MINQNINILDKNIANMIAAGEVVERPASVVKELVENSFDAGANDITVEIKNGGKTYIRVSDNGLGMSMINARKAFLRHATSKITNFEDLFNISTMGFRGEALAAIASVSKIEVITCSALDTYGTHMILEAGEERSCTEIGTPMGTTIVVRDLFFNTPARFNFLKKDSTETANIVSLVNKLAIAKPNVSFKLIVDGKLMFSTDKDSSTIDVIYTVFGKEISDNLIETYSGNAKIVVKGYVGKPRCSRSNRNYQLLYVNGRFVKSKTVTAAIDKAYHNLLMNGKHAVAVLFLDIPYNKIDVNVHPTKMEIKFDDDSLVFEMVYRAIKDSLEKENNFVNTVSEQERHTGDVPKVVSDFIKSIPPAERKALKLNDFKEYTTLDDMTGTNKTLTPDDFVISDEFLFSTAARPDDNFDIKDYSPRLATKLCENGHYMRQTHLDLGELSLKFSPDKYDDSYILTNEIDYKYIGELYKTYIIIESGTFYYFVDKHAAHERILFNKIYDQFKNSTKYAQSLMYPVPVSLSPEEADIAHTYKDEIEKYGYLFAEFGDNDILLRSVPYVISPGDTVSSFIELLDIFAKTGAADVLEQDNQAMKMLACKAAVKAGFDSSDEELEKFIKGLIQEGNVNYCPHGRPIMVEYKKSDLEKAFKRKI